MPTTAHTPTQHVLLFEDQYIVAFTIGASRRIYITAMIKLVDAQGNPYTTKSGKPRVKRINRLANLTTWGIVRDLLVNSLSPAANRK